MRNFGSYHPVVLMTYFAAVISLAMFTGHPMVIALALTGGICFDLLLGKSSEHLKTLMFFMLFFIMISLTNPLFSHKGATVLLFINSNPVTLESFYYGMGIGGTIVGVMYWFKNYSTVMTSDKFLYLFGRSMPRLTLVFSMVQRFVPLFIRRFRKVSDSRKALGGNIEKGVIARMRNATGIFSIMVTWSLEMAVGMSDSMKARGYGSGKRTTFSLYSFTGRDTVMLSVSIALFLIVMTGQASGALDFAYYPYVSGISFDLTVMPYYIGYACLVFLPVLTEVKENIQWKYLVSGI